MRNYDFFHPTMQVNIGNYFFDKGIVFDVYSSKESYFDWAKVRFTQKIFDFIKLSKMEEVQISIGYDNTGITEKIFHGYLKKAVNIDAFYEDELIAKDEMIKLEGTKITETFLNADPQEIIQFGLSRSGVTDVKLNNQVFNKKPMVAIREKNVIRLIDEVHRLWNIEEKFFFTPDRTFYWGEKPEQQELFEFVYGENIIDLRFENGFWIIKTIAAPFIRHSQLISIEHPNVEGSFEVFKLHHFVTDDGFPRTEIYFKESTE